MHLIFVPAHNEARTLPLVLQRIQEVRSDDILVVADGASDGTAAVAAAFDNVTVLDHAERQGYGGAMLSGFRYAMEHGYETVATMDADLQHDAGCLNEFFTCIEHCDVASGTRYHPLSKAIGEPPPERRHINEVVTGWIWSVTGYPLTDAFCGYKVYRVEALRKLVLQEKGPAFPIEFWIQAWHAGLQVVEVPTPRIYLDATRSFGGNLDRPETRLAYYEEVLNRSLEAVDHRPVFTRMSGCGQTASRRVCSTARR